MTAAYDIARVATECQRLVAAIDDAAKHPLPDWLHHRLATLRTEAEGAKRQIAHEFHSPTAGRAGSAETAEAKDAAVRPEVKR